MKTVLTKDLKSKQLLVTREFAAPLEKVWKAWTTSSDLEKWWAPRPWMARTKSMNFSEGGAWMYAMIGPKGEESWCKVEYKDIVPMKEFSHNDSFCDENGNTTAGFPSMNWKCSFHKTEAGTKVDIIITFTSEADLEQIIKMGFQEGFTMAHGNLDELLAN